MKLLRTPDIVMFDDNWCCVFGEPLLLYLLPSQCLNEHLCMNEVVIPSVGGYKV